MWIKIHFNEIELNIDNLNADFHKESKRRGSLKHFFLLQGITLNFDHNIVILFKGHEIY